MMASVRLFDALPDFGPRARMLSDADTQPAHRGDAQQPQFDMASTIRREVERAEAAVEERLARNHAAALQAEQERHQAEMAAQASKLGDLAGQTIAARIGQAEADILALVSATVARIVGGVLTEDIQKRSIESLARSVKAAMADTDAVRIEIRGPQSLFEALQAHLGERTDNIDYREHDGFDLTVSVDGRLFETRLSEWSSALSEILS